MSGYCYVNIRNKGIIPWIKKVGPLFAYKISIGMYQFLVRDPNVLMEVTTLEEGKRAERKYYAAMEEKKEIPIKEKEPSGIKENLDLKDSVVIEEVKVVKEPVVAEVPADSEDFEIDKILEAAPAEKLPEIKLDPISTEESERFKFYSDEELNAMTKLELKNILRTRGYEKGAYAPKYHDKIEDLIKKVKRTQTFN